MIVHNFNLDDSNFEKVRGNISTNRPAGWFAGKYYDGVNGRNENLTFDTEKYYPAVIESYDVINCEKDGKWFAYLSLNCNVMLDDGVWLLQYQMPVITTNTSKLVRLYFMLGFDIYQMQTLNFDDLIGCRLHVKIANNDTKKNHICDVA